METRIRLLHDDAARMAHVEDDSVDLIVTSPPYPMIEMWDEIFSIQDEAIRTCLEKAEGRQAFEHMHTLLDEVWGQCDRVLKEGGIACINIGDATRTLNADFQLYSNHSRILSHFLGQGFAALPDILWHKQTNAPNKFMGSGMLPVGAYVTYEHEYILILRKGKRRTFTAPADKARRRESAFFWEERNVWFSDIWSDIKGTTQRLGDAADRNRSAAYPFELAYRLICMFSIKGDVVLDPFLGTGTTMAVALATGRNGIGVELDASLLPGAREILLSLPEVANTLNHARLNKHLEFVAQRTSEGKILKHTNGPYGFPVMTGQERDLLRNDVLAVKEEGEGAFVVQ